MANPIQPLFNGATGSVTSNALSITVASLANGSSRVATLVDNTTNRYDRIYVYPKIKLGTSPTSNTLVTFYLIRDSGDGHATDAASATDAAFTPKQATVVYTMTTGGSAATGDPLNGDFYIDNPGPKWSIAVGNGTGVALDSTAGNHGIYWVGEYHQAAN